MMAAALTRPGDAYVPDGTVDEAWGNTRTSESLKLSLELSGAIAAFLIATIVAAALVRKAQQRKELAHIVLEEENCATGERDLSCSQHDEPGKGRRRGARRQQGLAQQRADARKRGAPGGVGGSTGMGLYPIGE